MNIYQFPTTLDSGGEINLQPLLKTMSLEDIAYLIKSIHTGNLLPEYAAELIANGVLPATYPLTHKEN
jgi:cation transporter-like permease